MSALPAYSSYGSPARERRSAPARPASPVRVVRGGAPLTSPHPAKSSIAVRVVICIALIAAGFFACLLRVHLSSTAVLASAETTRLEQDVADARSVATHLEVQQSLLSSPARISDEAQALGMVEPSDVAVITMEQDVVATDDAGSLSLSQSVSNAIEVGA